MRWPRLSLRTSNCGRLVHAVSCSAWKGGSLFRLINAAHLFPQGPSKELPRHRAGALCDKAAVTLSDSQLLAKLFKSILAWAHSAPVPVESKTEKLNKVVLLFINYNFSLAVDEYTWLCNKEVSWINRVLEIISVMKKIHSSNSW